MSILADQIQTARSVDVLGIEGRVQASTGMTVEARGLPVPIGSLCEIIGATGAPTPAEVIGFHRDITLLMPLSDSRELTKGQRVRLLTSTQKVPVGPSLLGRVVDAMGEPIDGGPSISVDAYYALHRGAPDAMKRPCIDTPISVGIRSINAMLTAGGGQRLGIFSGTGVGKSVLLGMMARYTNADVTVIALVGERGRELRDFIERDLGPDGLQRSVLVVSTSDQAPPLRQRACFTATAIAEYFRDQGADVLLLVDSLTRMAMAGRQIGLAAGEPPTRKGYPPSVFSTLPRLLERSGRTERGSITGIYTVLVEGDDINEPVADAVRGFLDGHIGLSRSLANRGHYPAVDVLESISRVMPDIVDRPQMEATRRVRRLLAVWQEIEDLVNIGAYAPGTNTEFDLVIRMRPAIEAFLRQGMNEGFDFEASRDALLALNEEIEKVEQTLQQARSEGDDGGKKSEQGGSGRSPRRRQETPPAMSAA